MYLDDVAKSLKDPNGTTLSTCWAILLAVFTIYGAAVNPIDTVPNDSSNFIDDSPYPGAKHRTVCKPIDT